MREGRRIKTIDPINLMIPFIMPHRSGASNLFEATMDITEAEKYLREKRLSGQANISMMHVFMAAYVRVVSQLPGINRFIRGQRIYARNGITISLTIKKNMALDAQETVVQVAADPKDTLNNVYDKLNALVEENKVEGDTNGTDTLAKFLCMIPRVFLKLVVWFLKTLDYFGWMPRFVTRLSPFHGSMFITNVGSLGIDAIYHHLYDFGNIPVFISMGKKKNVLELNDEGEIVKKKAISITVVTDERICDGHYYAEAFKQIRKYIEKPWLLENPPETVVEDVK